MAKATTKRTKRGAASAKVPRGGGKKVPRGGGKTTSAKVPRGGGGGSKWRVTASGRKLPVGTYGSSAAERAQARADGYTYSN